MAESTTRRMLRVRDTIDRRHAEAWALERLAALVHLSTSHVVRRFRATFGETPHQYLYRRRIERAQWLLRTTDVSVADVAVAVGYTSVGTFTRTFGRLVGETPTAHRARGPVVAAPACVVRAWTRPVGPGLHRPDPHSPDPHGPDPHSPDPHGPRPLDEEGDSGEDRDTRRP